MRPTRDELRARRRQALVLQMEGLTLKEIGRRIGHLDDPSKPLSAENARVKICQTIREVLKADDRSDPLWPIVMKMRDG